MFIFKVGFSTFEHFTRPPHNVSWWTAELLSAGTVMVASRSIKT